VTAFLADRLKAGAFAASVAVVALAAGAAKAETPYFADRTLTIIVGFSAGGGSDLGARAIAEFLPRHIPGNPNVIVQNMTGAGGITAANYIYERAPADGTEILFGSWYPMSEGEPGVRVRYDELTIVAPTTSPGGFITYMRPDAIPGGYTQPSDLLRADALRVTGVSPTSTVDQRLQLSFRTLGVDFIHVTGQAGLAAAAQAVRTGEMQASALALAGYLTSVEPNMVEPGIVVPLWHWALENDDGSPRENPLIPEGIPSFYEFHEAALGAPPSGPYWEGLRIVNDISELASHLFLGPNDLPSEAVEDLRTGIIATLTDPDYIEAASRISYPHIYVDVPTAQSILERVRNLDPEVRALVDELMAEQ
jgi:hypothetical protein